MNTVIKEMIDWSVENAMNFTAQDGTQIVLIDINEMRQKFDEWLNKEKQQLEDSFTEGFGCNLFNTETTFEDYYKNNFLC